MLVVVLLVAVRLVTPILVDVLLVIVPLVDPKLVEVPLVKNPLVAKMLVEVAFKNVAPPVTPRFVDVLFAITEDDARKVPAKARVLTAERYSTESPNAIPPVDEVEDARVITDEGVVVPNPNLLLVAS